MVLPLLIALAFPGAAAAQERTIVLDRFHALLEVDGSGGLAVTETIDLEFSGSWNGIIRSLPTRYRTPGGFDYRLRLREVRVTDGDGRPLEVEQSLQGMYRELKIWVPGASNAVRRVVIRYRVDNGLRFFDEHDELYWNVTGDEWVYPIRHAGAEVRLPPQVEGVRVNAFTGAFGAVGRDAEVEALGARARVATTRELGIREGLTIAVAWNPGVVRRPTATDRIRSFLRDNWLLGLPFLTLGLMGRLWYRIGRDPERRPIVPQYEPPRGLCPAEVGTLIDNRPDMRDITASIVDLAVRGYLRIEEEAPTGLSRLVRRGLEYRLVRLPDPVGAGDLRTHERLLLAGLFEERLSVPMAELEQRFYTHIPEIRNSLLKRLKELHIYRHLPEQVVGWWVAAGIGVMLLVGALGLALSSRFLASPLTAILAAVLSAVPVFAFGLVMPARTEEGTRILEEILGFREFLSRVEEDRFRRMITSPAMFEAYLPYAMALGVEQRWARAFEGVFREPPSWYVGRGPVTTFDTTRFVGKLGQMTGRAASAMTSQPRSSGGSGFSGGGGGGFSGGGFGGGGGRGF